MIKVIKNHGKTVHAYRLGEDSEKIQQLIKEKKIIPLPNDKFEVKSSETLSSQSEHGEIAKAGVSLKWTVMVIPIQMVQNGFIEITDIWQEMNMNSFRRL